MSIKWWEKTVEYFYIMNLIKKDFLFISPLDGNEEKAGDTILSNDNQWILIEFKRDSTSISNEQKKFEAFNDAKLVLQEKDGHHFIVYGIIINGQFTIKAQTYFSEKGIECDCLHNQGIDYNSFENYIKQLLKYKKYFGNNSSGGRNNIIEKEVVDKFAIIAGIKNNKIVECISAQDYICSLQATIEHTSERSRTMSRRRDDYEMEMGMGM